MQSTDPTPNRPRAHQQAFLHPAARGSAQAPSPRPSFPLQPEEEEAPGGSAAPAPQRRPQGSGQQPQTSCRHCGRRTHPSESCYLQPTLAPSIDDYLLCDDEEDEEYPGETLAREIAAEGRPAPAVRLADYRGRRGCQICGSVNHIPDRCASIVARTTQDAFTQTEVGRSSLTRAALAAVRLAPGFLRERLRAAGRENAVRLLLWASRRSGYTVAVNAAAVGFLYQNSAAIASLLGWAHDDQ